MDVAEAKSAEILSWHGVETGTLLQRLFGRFFMHESLQSHLYEHRHLVVDLLFAALVSISFLEFIRTSCVKNSAKFSPSRKARSAANLSDPQALKRQTATSRRVCRCIGHVVVYKDSSVTTFERDGHCANRRARQYG